MSAFLSKIFKSSRTARPFCSAVIVAAGSGVRMNGINKLFSLLDGKPVLIHTLAAFEESADIDEIIVVSRAEEIFEISELIKEYGFEKVTKVISGGERRQDSVLAGLLEVSPRSELAAIHDGARPLVSEKVVESAIKAANEYNAAAPAVPVKDTVKVVKSGTIQSTPARSELYAVQTPQVFKTDLIKAAITDAIREKIEMTDDCMAVERLGITVKITEGDYENIKITTPTDLVIAEAILREREVSGK